MKLKIEGESGLGHLFAPLLGLVLVVVIGASLNVVTSAQAKNEKKTKVHHYSKSEKRAFAIAASAYWGNPQREDQADHAKKKILRLEDKETTCQPRDVKYEYYNDPKEKAEAWAVYYSAIKQRVSKKSSQAEKSDARYYNKKVYCRIHFNDAFSADLARHPGYACAVFIHEYGHMLGRDHNTNPHSPMYNGYVKGYGGSPESYDTNTLDTISKSLCYLSLEGGPKK